MLKKNVFRVVLPCAIVLLSGSLGYGQLPGSSLNAALTRLFGTNAGFTAKADVMVLDKAQKESMRMPMSFSVLGEKIRVDTDINNMKSVELLPEVMAAFKREGLDRVS